MSIEIRNGFAELLYRVARRLRSTAFATTSARSTRTCRTRTASCARSTRSYRCARTCTSDIREEDRLMADVTQIAVATKNEKRKALVIDLLERMLAEAKEGSGFESGIFLATYPDSGRLRSAWTEGDSTIEIVGRLEYLKHGLLFDMAMREEDGPPPPPAG
jgi:hypothetical protein